VITGDVGVVLPMMCLAGGAFGVYLVAHWITSRNKILALGTTFVLALALAAQIWLGVRVARGGAAVGRFAVGAVTLQATPDALFIGGIALGLGVCSALYSGCYLTLDQRYPTYYPLFLWLLFGLLGMTLTRDLFNLYLFCELMSIAAYVLVAFRRQTDTAIEAGFKYLMMGSVGTLTMLLGIAWIYRETGSVTLMTPAAAPGPWTRAGLACLWVGLGVKSAFVPLHTWLPDAHGRAPSSVSALLSGIVIQSAFYVLLKVSLALGLPPQEVGLALIVLACLNMTVGNLMALVQGHVKRLLAYSTIAQMGYIMLGIGVGLRHELPAAVQAGFFLLLAHAVMKGLAFLSKGVCHFYCHTTTLAEVRGIVRRLPAAAITLTLALAGLAGIPPLAGFAGKWFLLAEILHAADGITLVGAAIFLLNTLLSLGYYLPLIATLYAPGPAAAPIPVSPWMQIPLWLLAALVIMLGVYPGPWWTLVSWAVAVR